jgi:hypothetical protein
LAETLLASIIRMVRIMEAVSSPETSYIYQTIQCSIPEGSHLPVRI